MATTSSILTTAASQPWSYTVSGDGTLKLNTSGKYLDRNIEIVVPKGAYSASVTADANASKNSTPPVITPSIGGTITSAATILTSAPANGTDGTDYFTIDPNATIKTAGSATVSGIKGTATIGTAGYLPTGSKDSTAASYTVSNISATVEGGSNLYLPIKKLTSSMVSKVNYIEDAGDVTSGYTDKLSITISAPAGYYDGSPLTVEYTNILPNVDADMAASYLLTGRTAYNQAGLKIVGTMPNNGTLAAADISGTKGAGSVTGSSLTLDASNSASGISVTGSGSVTPKATTKIGYYQAGTVSGSAISSNTATKYLTDITIAANKTLNSVTNNGTITTLSGTGTIANMSGDQTISSLTGSITVSAASDANTSTVGSNAKVIFHDASLNKDVTLVKDGAVVQGSATEGTGANAGKLVISSGWIDADATVNIGSGNYSATLSTSTNPSVKYTKSTTMATTTTNTGYSFTYGGTVTKGTYIAKAEITSAGYIGAGNKTAGSANNVDVAVSDAGTVYIQAAVFGAATGSEKYAASGNRPASVVPTKYNFSVSTEGYSSVGTKKTIDVFGGDYDWITA